MKTSHRSPSPALAALCLVNFAIADAVGADPFYPELTEGKPRNHARGITITLDKKQAHGTIRDATSFEFELRIMRHAEGRHEVNVWVRKDGRIYDTHRCQGFWKARLKSGATRGNAFPYPNPYTHPESQEAGHFWGTLRLDPESIESLEITVSLLGKRGTVVGTFDAEEVARSVWGKKSDDPEWVAGEELRRARQEGLFVIALEGTLGVHPKYLYKYYIDGFADGQKCALIGLEEQLKDIAPGSYVLVLGDLETRYHGGGTADNPSPFGRTIYIALNVRSVKVLREPAPPAPRSVPKPPAP